tara:strand:+ start:751 stop:1248 length:498 start_codon:yes stop_codon:yes gene_type:complete
MTIEIFDKNDIRRRSLDRKSPLIKDVSLFNQISNFDNLILGHHTSDTFLDSIIENGLLTPAQTGNSFEDGLPSDQSTVYLASTFDNYWLARATEKYGGNGIIVVVEVPRRNLLPDKEGRTLTEDDNSSLFHSIMRTGCKHKGKINPWNIKEIYNSSGDIIYGGTT